MLAGTDSVDQKAKLIEIISSNTRETGTSERRKRALTRINQIRKKEQENENDDFLAYEETA
jgi:hypothetical protein